MHHLVGATIPQDRKPPMFHQCYKFDMNESTNYRIMNPAAGTVVRRNILRNIEMVLREHNFLFKQYKTANDIMKDLVLRKKQIKNVFIVLRAPSEVFYHGNHHKGTLEVSSNKEVNSMLYTCDEDGSPPKNGVYIVHRQFGGKIEVLGYWNPLQDPIGYPLLFPRGNAGYKRKEYLLGKNYVNDDEELQRNLDDEEEGDAYPFEMFDDEMDKRTDGIDYEAARIKHRKYRRDLGETVSDSEDDEDDEDEDEIVTDEEEEEEEVEQINDVLNVEHNNVSQEETHSEGVLRLDISDEEDAESGAMDEATHTFLDFPSDDNNSDEESSGTYQYEGS